MRKEDMPFEAWELIQAKEIIKWIRVNMNWSLNSLSLLETIEGILFDVAYDKLGMKPISKCSIQELQEELKRRGM